MPKSIPAGVVEERRAIAQALNPHGVLGVSVQSADDLDAERIVNEVLEQFRQKAVVAQLADVLGALACVELTGIDTGASEHDVGVRLSAALNAKFGSTARSAVVGVDGSVRNPDHVVELRETEEGPVRRLAVEYKLHRSRHQGAGELDRGLGQCVAYAEAYDAVILAAIYMAAPETEIPVRWVRHDKPAYFDRDGRRVPVYLLARPLDWSATWASRFFCRP